MTSDRKTKANRANARVSTGPKTFHGRTRAARNAFRHGLSLAIQSDPTLGEEAQALAGQIAGPNASAQMQMLAYRVAEAEVDLRRVRLARHQLMSPAVSNPLCDSRANGPQKMTAIPRLALANAPEAPTPQGANKIATILSRAASALAAMDRYERRARSRRKFAIRAFDAARGGQDREELRYIAIGA